MQEKRLTKSFLSSVKECEWLNGLGQKGYKLIDKRDGKYVFEEDELQTWHYSVEWLDHAPDSEEGQAYIRSRAESGAELAATYSLWAYFISPEPIPVCEEGKRRTAVHYRNIALLLYLFDAITAVLIGYHFMIRPFLEKQGVLLKAPELKKSGIVIVDLARRLVYGAKQLIYLYGKLWAKLFGESQAALVLGILIPLAIVLSVAAAYWTEEWHKNRPEKKRIETQKGQEGAEATDEQSEVSGEAAERS